VKKMSVSLNLITQVEEDVMEKAVQTIEESLKMLLPDVKTNVALTICDDEYIKELNQQYRGKNSATDVLSFPLLSADAPGKVSYAPTDIDPDTQELMLGDIIISLEKAKAQAEEYGHSIVRELCYLVVHSVLHLVGYDHMTEVDKKLMRAKEEEILRGLGIER